MTTQTIEVVYEDGVLKPLVPLPAHLVEGQYLQVVLQIEAVTTSENLKETIKQIKTYKSIEEIRNSPEYKLNVSRRAGSSEGLIKIAEDFDEPLEEFKDYM